MWLINLLEKEKINFLFGFENEIDDFVNLIVVNRVIGMVVWKYLFRCDKYLWKDWFL